MFGWKLLNFSMLVTKINNFSMSLSICKVSNPKGVKSYFFLITKEGKSPNKEKLHNNILIVNWEI
jgi:hypothetical protein